ncbi:hypothetical protein CVT24_013395 [Panaeolus cyanescens]|uniref:F-box domain-containing protein n=1 Tax=Panaeolus cyanescens TaxID=181874 RepID=A0A409YMR6_9AGAR|nr:hypothetical protein CVT24_013395 [Panaeolus cyanescens]
MTSILDLPSEALATVFEIGVHVWGVGYLHHASLVCKDWHWVAISYPHLWGIINVDRSVDSSRCLQLQQQLVRAKGAPLDITCHTSNNNWPKIKNLIPIFKRLRQNFVRLEVSIPFLLATDCTCDNIRNGLDVLDLSWGGQNPTAYVDTEFFEDREGWSRPRLHSFTARSLPPSWIAPFLSPFITRFRLYKTSNRRPSHVSSTSPITETLQYLAKVPNVRHLELEGLKAYRRTGGPPVPEHDTSLKVSLAHLQNLEITDVSFQSSILCGIEAPCLQTLAIRNSENNDWRWDAFIHDFSQLFSDSPADIRIETGSFSLTPLFLQWSNPQVIPTNLNTLELSNVLCVDDIPFLIKWLQRLPNLVRLIINDADNTLDRDLAAGSKQNRSMAEQAVDTQDIQRNLCHALSRPTLNPSTGIVEWVCPLLTILHLGDVEIRAKSLMAITRARGGLRLVADFSNKHATPAPARLHRLTMQICQHLSQEDNTELQALVKEVGCTCLACSFQDAL